MHDSVIGNTLFIIPSLFYFYKKWFLLDDSLIYYNTILTTTLGPIIELGPILQFNRNEHINDTYQQVNEGEIILILQI